MAAAVAVAPVSVPTGAGTREQVDLGYPLLKLQKLDNPQVSIHQCAQRFGSQGIRSIFEKLGERDLPCVYEEVNLADNLIGDEGAKYLQEGLSNNSNLKKLIIPRAGIKKEGFAAIGGLLAETKSLEMLVMSSNLADPEGVAGEFSAGLSKNKSLRSLVLAACRLQNQGVQTLAEGPLKTHPKLEHVCLTYNRLEDTVCASITKMLSVNQTLRYLDLCGNSLGPEGAEELVKGLRANKGKLTRLGLGQNNIRLRGAKALCTHFTSKEGQTLEFLDLRHNIVTYRGVVEIRKQLGKPLEDDNVNLGWMILFGERQLMLNAL
eukprot:TRINITY_DN4845_c0_g1_i1.p1 TRINITY_DN4845_c0_g1~~TRINITY_DN4845_c0_g1_i1.p1  ORF type:complete len:320 (+),score=78.07 TRINITY_DN4845_c0_g1_i1:150-1109(+)